MVASESVALDALGFELVRDILPGEAVFIRQGGVSAQPAVWRARKGYTPCMFEYVYFARPDSIIDRISVYKSRLRMGESLRCQDSALIAPTTISMSLFRYPTPAAPVRFCRLTRLGVKYREGFIKNRYIGRTFIMPGQEMRKRSVKRKLNAIELEFRDKDVLLVDDSIVRGTTSQQIIEMAREAGAKKVYFASASPPVRYPNVFGIDMPAASRACCLRAHGKRGGRLYRRRLADLSGSYRTWFAPCATTMAKIQEFDASCFSGEYVTGDVTARVLATDRSGPFR